jgi:hypothetical protein
VSAPQARIIAALLAGFPSPSGSFLVALLTLRNADFAPASAANLLALRTRLLRHTCCLRIASPTRLLKVGSC